MAWMRRICETFSHCGFTQNVCSSAETRVEEKEESSDGGDEEEYTSTNLDTRNLPATSGGSEGDAKEGEVTEALKEKASDVKEKQEDIKTAISGGSENGGKEGEEKITEVLKENNSGMMDVVEEKLEDIKEMASDVKEAVEETFEDLKESASEAAEVVKDKLEDSLEKASEMLKTDEGIKSGAFFVFGLLGALGAGFYFGRTGDAGGTLLLGGNRSILVKVFGSSHNLHTRCLHHPCSWRRQRAKPQPVSSEKEVKSCLSRRFSSFEDLNSFEIFSILK